MSTKPEEQPISPADQTPAATPTTSRRLTPAKTFFLVIAGIVLLLGLVSTGYAFAYSKKILPRTTVAGIQVGGMTRDQALSALDAKEKAFLDQDLVVTDGLKSWTIKPKNLNLTFGNADAVDQAFLNGKTGGFLSQVRRTLGAPIKSHAYAVDVYQIPETGRDYLRSAALKEIEQDTSETTLRFGPGKTEVVPGVVGKRLDYPDFNHQLYAALAGTLSGKVTFHLQDFAPEVTAAQAEEARKRADVILADAWKVQADDLALTLTPQQISQWFSTDVDRDSTGKAVGLVITTKDDLIKKSLEEWSKTVNRKPVNARLKGENGAISVAEQAKNGLSLDVDKTVASIKTALLDSQIAQQSQLSRTVPAATVVAIPDLRADTVGELGIKELIGSATTDFTGSPNNRKVNIGVGQRALNGILVKDGETFSTIGHLTPIDQTTGYLPELVILNNRTVPEYGGGLCQVSTTLFRSVLNAGLPVTERTNHSYRVGYYERGVGPGLDATVYDPNPDFKWRNDTGRAIYVQSYVTGTTITFELYGTKDGRQSSISAPQILSTTPSGDPIYSNTDTLFKGEQKQIETAHDGAQTLVTYTVTRNGQAINTQKFYSTYKPWPAQYLVGTKER